MNSPRDPTGPRRRATSTRGTRPATARRTPRRPAREGPRTEARSPGTGAPARDPVTARRAATRPARPTPWGKIIGIGCGVLLLLLLLGGGCTAIALISAGVGDRATEGSGERAPGDEGLTETRGAEVTAGETDFEPSPLYAEGVYTSVAVSVTNSGEEQLDVNPLYFSIVDEEGSVHSTSEAIGMDANELGAQTLAPGQTTSGAITVEGRVDAARVVFEPFYSGPVEAPVT
ncbi:DUF4352 domain-containing protein [Nocardiopsis tropica]|nr:DUF4352 domain-containing protein [Nocardiopsis tropica]